MSLFSGIEIPGHPDLENVRRLDLLPIPSLRLQHRLGFAINPPYFRDLSSQFTREMADLERDISSYIPHDKLDEFVSKANRVEGHETEEEVEAREAREARGDVDGDTDDENSPVEKQDSSINAASAEQIGKLLFDILGIGADKKLKRTASGRVSTGKAQLRDLELEHPVVRLILEYRERAKLKGTYTEAMVRQARLHPRGPCCPICELPHQSDTWRIHTEITTTRAETGRFSSKNPNLQNIPQRTKLGTAVRAGFVASPGTKLVSVDFSQIELRVMAHLANCNSMIQVYKEGGDIHDQTAMECFGLRSKEEIDKISHRIPSKTANFLCQYGGSGPALYSQLMMSILIMVSEKKLPAVPEWLTVDWCNTFVSNWFFARPEVRDYLDLQTYRARRYGMVWDIFGRIRLTPEVRSEHKWIRQAGERQGGNMADQGSAAGMMKLAIAEVEEMLGRWRREAGIWCYSLLPVHDQLIVECEEDYAEVLLDEMVRIFNEVMVDKETGVLRFRVPILSDGEVMECWKKG